METFVCEGCGKAIEPQEKMIKMLLAKEFPDDDKNYTAFCENCLAESLTEEITTLEEWHGKKVGGYVLYDGDYSLDNAELLEKLLLEKLGDKYDDSYECAIDNAYEIAEVKYLALIICHSPSTWMDSEDEETVKLTDEEVEIVLNAIPDPGNGPYFRWEPNFQVWLDDMQEFIENRQTKGEFDWWVLHLSDLNEKTVNISLRNWFQSGMAYERAARIYARYCRKYKEEKSKAIK